MKNTSIEVIYSPIDPVTDPRAGYPGLKRETLLLKKGSCRYEDSAPLPCDMILEKDVAIKLRDGATVYANIYKPVTDEKLPVIIGWGPTGKHAARMPMPPMPGVSKKGMLFNDDESENTWKLSGYEMSGTQDPAYWCQYGYAVAAVDPRGVFMSEGKAQYHSDQDAEDFYDVVEWMGVQDWCSGKVGTSGNGWRGMVQWHMASLQPPHLAAIAPWEGHCDLFGYEMCRGGIPKGKDGVGNHTFGTSVVEDVGAMIEKYTLRNDYWLTKRVEMEKVVCPAYVVSAYSSGKHGGGTFDAFRYAGSEEKWLRAHNTTGHEDFYDMGNLADLRKFFDYYLKGVKNDWPETPKVRIPVFDHGGEDIVCRNENEWPLARQQYKAFYLDAASGKMAEAPFEKESSVKYEADSGCGYTTFTYRFEQETELTGYMDLVLWLEAEGNDDMDVFVQVIKLNRYGMPVHQFYVDMMGHKYWGADARIRVSRRELDPERSKPYEPYLSLAGEKKLAPGETVKAEIGLWPTGMLFHEGESMMVYVSTGKAIDGQDYHGAEGCVLINKGNHIIHTGGKYESCLYVPVIPKS